jgi:glycosyltransferase involved in cell wall biosynthesis
VLVSNYQDPQEHDYLVALASARQVHLSCLVNISEPELQSLYGRAGCVAYAPVREPFGLVALEAMAAAAPLVGVSEGGPAETIIPGETGVVAPREARAFGQALGSLLSNPEQATQLGLAARRHVCTTWTWERHMAQLEQLLIDTAHLGTAQLTLSSE